MSATLVVPARFNGPPTSANGGWVAGALAGSVRSGLAVRVTLLAPPPLDVELEVVDADAGVELRDAGRTLMTAAPTDEISVPVPAVDRATAETARAGFLATAGLPFMTCFVCGTDRPDGDGLRVHAGPVTPGDWTHVATTVTTTEFAAAPELPWAVLDCPGGFATVLTAAPALLASYTVRVVDEIGAGETGVLVAVDDGPRGTSGRARGARSAFYGDDGRLLAHADAVWVRPRAD